jgi:hypothetical protein
VSKAANSPAPLTGGNGRSRGQDPDVFFTLPDWALALIIVGIVAVAFALGAALGVFLRAHSETLREPFGVVQGAILGVVGLILAFALTLAVGRYEDRRAAVVNDANTIGTTYLRAQTLSEPERTTSLALLRQYAGLAVDLSSEVPNSAAMEETARRQSSVQRRLWHLAGRTLVAAPTATAPRLYLDSLNAMIDQQTIRLSALKNRVPAAVLGLELIAAAIALAMLTLYLSVLGRGHTAIGFAAVLVTGLLLVTFDLDRPTRGMITRR